MGSLGGAFRVTVEVTEGVLGSGVLWGHLGPKRVPDQKQHLRVALTAMLANFQKTLVVQLLLIIFSCYEVNLEPCWGYLGATLGNFWVTLVLLWITENGFG